jgi:tellurite resistance protein TerC
MMLWGIFFVVVISLLALDLGVFNRQSANISLKKSLYGGGFYISIAILFGLWTAYTLGIEKMSLFYTGYLVEQSLSLDNLFVIALIFKYFKIPRQYQHRALFWGIMGVLVLRGIMISAGALLISKFAWLLYLFGVLLILMGLKMLLMKENKKEIKENFLLRFLKKHFLITAQLHANHFWIKAPHPVFSEKKVTWFTPLFVALILIETADIVFAVDSIPAIFAITTDPYIVYTSNIFAILGLRSIYFALEAVMERFVYLPQALSIILIFIGSKVFISYFLGLKEFPALLSLGITLGILAGGIGGSLWKTRKI